jgi:protein gp37
VSENSKIEWTHHTFNPVWGCTKVSAGCAHCYAETLAKRYGNDVWGPGERRTFGDKHWAEPLKWARDARKAGERRRVFCGSMCDVFEEHPTTQAQLPQLMDLISATAESLGWLLLTKRPERAGAYLREWLAEDATRRPEWWLGTSVEDQASADLRIPKLLATPAAFRFVSYEPALGPVDFKRIADLPHGAFGWFAECPKCDWRGLNSSCFTGDGWLVCPACRTRLGEDAPVRPERPGIDWLICGGESGPHARPMHPSWARSARDQCVAAGVPYFFKQYGEWKNGSTRERKRDEVVLNDGRHRPSAHDFDDKTKARWHDFDPCIMSPAGKKAAGRELDGRMWDEFPEVSHA